MGSIPVRVTKTKTTPKGVVFCFAAVSFIDTAFVLQTHGFAFCEQGDGSSLTRAASKNLRAAKFPYNLPKRIVDDPNHTKGRAKLAEKSQNIYLKHGRGELCSPAGVRRTPLRIIKS